MFERRAEEMECLDDPQVDAASAAQSYRFMQIVNRRFGGISAVSRFLETHTRPGETVRVLDLGSGACDIPPAVSKRLRRSKRRVEFTCLEINPAALAMARQNIATAHEPFIRLVESDVFEYEPKEAFDYAVGSMFFHHLSNERIVELVNRLRRFVRRGVLINDLYRSRFNYLACRLAVFAAEPIVKHDALLSIRRGFTERDLRQLLGQVDCAKVVVERCWFYRISAAILFKEPSV